MVSVFDLLVLSQIPHIGISRLRDLVDHFKTSSAILTATARELSSVQGFSRNLASEIRRHLSGAKMDEWKRYASQQITRVGKSNGRIISFWDKEYPDLLRKIYDPPVMLFCKGTLSDDDQYAIAIVGTRHPTPYGCSIAHRFAAELSQFGITVVSGLARGIDTIAHRSSLQSHGRTIAITGSGLDIPYPPENRLLYESIPRSGAILTEYPMGSKPDAANFPKRNRIISGMTLGTLVVETDVNGGGMITANTALEQNRDVFAIPGLITSVQSKGCHSLIKTGRALLVESVGELIDELRPRLKPLFGSVGPEPRHPGLNLNLFEKTIFDTLGDEAMHIDSIAHSTKCSTAEALVHLLTLEFKGAVRQLPGKMFVRV